MLCLGGIPRRDPCAAREQWVLCVHAEGPGAGAGRVLPGFPSELQALGCAEQPGRCRGHAACSCPTVSPPRP